MNEEADTFADVDFVGNEEAPTLGNWIQCFDEDSGCPYLYNDLTGETKWVDASSSNEILITLWQKFYDDNGDEFFYNPVCLNNSLYFSLRTTRTFTFFLNSTQESHHGIFQQMLSLKKMLKQIKPQMRTTSFLITTKKTLSTTATSTLKHTIAIHNDKVWLTTASKTYLMLV